MGVFKLFATMFAVLYVENYGRRKLLFIGNALMLVALVTLSISFIGDDGSSSSSSSSNDDSSSSEGLGAKQIVTLVGMFVYIGGYQVGFGPIAWLMISECFPLEIRGQVRGGMPVFGRPHASARSHTPRTHATRGANPSQHPSPSPPPLRPSPSPSR